jgi:hypothetical protein
VYIIAFEIVCDTNPVTELLSTNVDLLVLEYTKFEKDSVCASDPVTDTPKRSISGYFCASVGMVTYHGPHTLLGPDAEMLVPVKHVTFRYCVFCIAGSLRRRISFCAVTPVLGAVISITSKVQAGERLRVFGISVSAVPEVAAVMI